MCKGRIKDKAINLFHTIAGPENKSDDETISWRSGRMVNAFKKLLFFSEIFPKKYQTEFVKELLHQ